MLLLSPDAHIFSWFLTLYFFWHLLIFIIEFRTFFVFSPLAWVDGMRLLINCLLLLLFGRSFASKTLNFINTYMPDTRYLASNYYPECSQLSQLFVFRFIRFYSAAFFPQFSAWPHRRNYEVLSFGLYRFFNECSLAMLAHHLSNKLCCQAGGSLSWTWSFWLSFFKSKNNE